MRVRLAGESAAQILLLTATWLVVGTALHSAGPAVVAAGRTAFTVAGLLVLTRRTVTTNYRWGQIALLAGSGVTAYTLLSTVAIALAGPALPSLVLALMPAVVLAAQSALAHRRPATTTLIGTAAAVAGAVLYVLPRLTGTLGDDILLGTLCATGAMLSMSFYGLYFAHVNRDHTGPMAPRILPVFALGTLPLTGWAALDLATGASVTPTAVALLAALGIVIYVPAYLVQHRILLTAGPAYSALLGLAVPPLVGLTSAGAGLAPLPGTTQTAGMLLTLAGMTLVIRAGSASPGSSATEPARSHPPTRQP